MASSISLKTQLEPQVAPPEPSHPAPRPSRVWFLWVAGAVVLAAVVTIGVLARRGRSTPVPAAGAPTFVSVTRGHLLRSVRVGGTVAAVHFATVSAPALRGGNFGQLTVVRLAEAGAKIKEGDVLAEFDRQLQRNNYEDHQAEYISQTDAMAKRGAELDVEKEQRKTDLQKAIADVESARLENRRNEVISRIDAEKNQQALAEAEATLKMLRETQKLRDDAAAAELKLLDIRRERERLQMEHARFNYERMIVKSPISGMVVLQSIWKGGNMGPVQEGDQVRPGMPFLQVVDSSEMVVRSRVNQVDAALLRPGGPVQIHLDAYPDLSFPGTVKSVSTLAQSSSFGGKVKTFTVVFGVNGTEARLIPDISASVDIKIEQVPDALLVPRGAVVRQAGSRQAGFVWVKNGDQVRPRAVELGPANDTRWAITSGLKEGELVATLPPPGAPGATSAPKPSGATVPRRDREGARAKRTPPGGPHAS